MRSAGRVFLVRHGRTVLNAEGRLRGLADPPLDDEGRAEVAAEITRRVRAVLDEQVDLLGEGPVVLVSHDATNSRLLSDLDPDHPDPDIIGQRTACWNELDRQDDRWIVVAVVRKS